MQTITAQDVKHMWDRGEDFLLVNTMPAEDFARTKVLAAVSIPEEADDFANLVLQKTGSREKAVVVYGANRECDCASKAAMKLLDAGFQNVRIFEDGAEGWQQFTKTKSAGAFHRW